jgi:hypothetical protein
VVANVATYPLRQNELKVLLPVLLLLLRCLLRCAASIPDSAAFELRSP